MEYKNISFTVWDVGGQDKVQFSSVSIYVCLFWRKRTSRRHAWLWMIHNLKQFSLSRLYSSFIIRDCCTCMWRVMCLFHYYEGTKWRIKGEMSEWVVVYRRSCSSFMHDFLFWCISFAQIDVSIATSFHIWYHYVNLSYFDQCLNTPFQQVLCTVYGCGFCLLAHVYSITIYFFILFLI